MNNIRPELYHILKGWMFKSDEQVKRLLMEVDRFPKLTADERSYVSAIERKVYPEKRDPY